MKNILIILHTLLNISQQPFYEVSSHVYIIQPQNLVGGRSSYISSDTIPFENQKLYIRQTLTTSILMSIATNQNGSFIIYLPKGKYDVVSSNKRKSPIIKDVEQMSKEEYLLRKRCMDEWYQTPDFVLEVMDTPNSLNYYISSIFPPECIPNPTNLPRQNR